MSITSELITQNNQRWREPLEPNQELGSLIQEAMRENKLVLVIGPCALQSLEQMTEILTTLEQWLSKNQQSVLVIVRAPHQKPRTRSISDNGQERLFDGVGVSQARQILGELLTQFPQTLFAVEVMDPEDIAQLADLISLGWIGARTVLDRTVRKLGEAAAKVNLPLMVKNPQAPDWKTHVGMVENAIAGETMPQQPNQRTLTLVCLRGRAPFTDEEKSHWRNVPNWEDIQKIKDLAPNTPVIADLAHLLTANQMSVDTILELAHQAIEAGADGLMMEINTPNHPSWTDKGVDEAAFLAVLPQLIAAKLDQVLNISQPAARVERNNHAITQIMASTTR